MWLMNTRTKELHAFRANTDEVPPYAILSHVWRQPEVLMQDIQDPHRAQSLHSFHVKLKPLCALALADGFEWVWVDTCCIDQTSSAELSESINSMYTLYSRAGICYAFLDDVPPDEDPELPGSAFRRSKWHTRGWTLQELIAPSYLEFVATDWSKLGSKESLAAVVEDVTNVDRTLLLGKIEVDSISIAKRMSWAARRETTRLEDRAYSLMGIFGVFMPTIYGEGEQAFIRLQLEILRRSTDQSIFAWGKFTPFALLGIVDLNTHIQTHPRVGVTHEQLLAPSPDFFSSASDITSLPIKSLARLLDVHIPVPECAQTSYGIRMQFPTIPLHSLFASSNQSLALLACQHRGSIIALLLQDRSTHVHYVGSRKLLGDIRGCIVPLSAIKLLCRATMQTVYIHHPIPTISRHKLGQSGPRPNPVIAFMIPQWVLAALFKDGFVPRRSDGWSMEKASLVLTRTGQSRFRGERLVFQSVKTGEGFSLLTIGGLVGDSESLNIQIEVFESGLVPSSDPYSIDRWDVEHITSWPGGTKACQNGTRLAVEVSLKNWDKRAMSSNTITFAVDIKLVPRSELDEADTLYDGLSDPSDAESLQASDHDRRRRSPQSSSLFPGLTVNHSFDDSGWTSARSPLSPSIGSTAVPNADYVVIPPRTLSPGLVSVSDSPILESTSPEPEAPYIPAFSSPQLQGYSQMYHNYPTSTPPFPLTVFPAQFYPAYVNGPLNFSPPFPGNSQFTPQMANWYGM